MWKCKCCGESWFHQEKIIDEINEHGVIKKFTDEEIVCSECGDRGYIIEDIAEWVEDDKIKK